MKIASWNVNSLRVRLPQVLEWLKKSNVDILAIQETKVEDNYFGFQVPTKLSKVDETICQPSFSWTLCHDYDVTAQKLVGMFKENYTQFLDPNMTDYSKFGPK